jgi:hypothetical protein
MPADFRALLDQTGREIIALAESSSALANLPRDDRCVVSAHWLIRQQYLI